jgi:hypothetical protein
MKFKVKSNGNPVGTGCALFIVAFSLFCWCYNLKKLIYNDDWNFSNPKSEIVHLVGVIAPPLSLFTCWYDEK